MQTGTLKEQIRESIVRKFPLARSIGNADDLLGGGIIDSLGILEIVTLLESAYGVTMTDEDLTPENFQSVDCIASFVERKLNDR